MRCALQGARAESGMKRTETFKLPPAWNATMPSEQKELEHLGKHFEKIKSMELLPEAWFWHKDAARAWMQTAEAILKEFEQWHDQQPQSPAKLMLLTELEPVLENLYKNIEVLEKSGMQDKRTQTDWAAQVNNLITLAKKTLASYEQTIAGSGVVMANTITQAEREERLKQLYKWGVPGNYGQTNEFLIRHWEGTKRIATVEIVNSESILGFEAEQLRKAGMLTEENWPFIVQIAETCKENTWQLYRYGLPELYHKGIFTQENRPWLSKLVQAAPQHAGYIFAYDLPVFKEIGMLNEQNWPALIDGFAKMSEAAIESSEISSNAKNVFQYRIPALFNDRTLTQESWPWIVKFVQATKQTANSALQYVLSLFKKYDLLTEENWPIIIESYAMLTSVAEGDGGALYNSIFRLGDFFEKFRMATLTHFIVPIAKSQTVATFIIFREIGSWVTDRRKGYFNTVDDLDAFARLIARAKRRSKMFINSFLTPCIDHDLIDAPLSREEQTLMRFMDESPAWLPDLYRIYRNILKGSVKERLLRRIFRVDPNASAARIAALFKDAKKFKKDVIEGTLNIDLDNQVHLAILMSVFPPELTVGQDEYRRILEQRTDRQSDLPALGRLRDVGVRISKGGWIQREEVNTNAWSSLVEAVRDVNQHPVAIDPARLGLDLLREHQAKTLATNRKKYLKAVYAYFTQTAHRLPDFRADHDTLMQYKEFIGDRLKNDIILTLLKEASEKHSAEFAQLLGKKADYSQLAKAISQTWKTNRPDRQQIAANILQRNGFTTKPADISWPGAASSQEINSWLIQNAPATIDKNTVQLIFNDLTGEEYVQMIKEAGKYEFRKDGKILFGTPFRFLMSKHRAHSVAMFSMGVCVAVDKKLWNQPDFWQMIIFDEDQTCTGGVIYRTIEEDGKKYLVLSIQPSSSMLNSVSPDQVYDKIIRHAQAIAHKLSYDAVLIPTDSTINSNRSSIQTVIAKNQATITLKQTYDFSYDPFHYTYNEFYLVQ